MVSGAFLSLTKIFSSIRISIVCTSCDTSYNASVIPIPGGGSLKFRGGVKKIQSPDFRSPEVGISVITTYRHDLLNPLKCFPLSIRVSDGGKKT